MMLPSNATPTSLRRGEGSKDGLRRKRVYEEMTPLGLEGLFQDGYME